MYIILNDLVLSVVSNRLQSLTFTHTVITGSAQFNKLSKNDCDVHQQPANIII